MITTSIIWIILFISISLIVTGFYFKKRALLLVILGSILIMITGLITLYDPISYPTMDMQYTYDNGSITNITEQINPTPIDPTINNVLSWLFMLLGLAGIIGTSIKMYDSRFDEEDPEQIQIFD